MKPIMFALAGVAAIAAVTSARKLPTRSRCN